MPLSYIDGSCPVDRVLTKLRLYIYISYYVIKHWLFSKLFFDLVLLLYVLQHFLHMLSWYILLLVGNCQFYSFEVLCSGFKRQILPPFPMSGVTFHLNGDAYNFQIDFECFSWEPYL